jgi:hypothetical protein
MATATNIASASNIGIGALVSITRSNSLFKSNPRVVSL